MDELIRFELRDDVALLTMDDGKANALSYAMLEAIHGAFDRAEREAKAVVLAGRPGKFCAGFDLKEMMKGPEQAKALVTEGAAMYMRLYTHPQPLVAACTGHAMAGGALLLLVADTRIGEPGAFKLGLNEVAISMTLPLLARELARDRLSKRHLTAATIQAALYDPATSVDVGYLDRVAGEGGAVDEAVAEAMRLATLPAQAYANTKRKMREATVELVQAGTARDLDDLLAD